MPKKKQRWEVLKRVLMIFVGTIITAVGLEIFWFPIRSLTEELLDCRLWPVTLPDCRWGCSLSF